MGIKASEFARRRRQLLRMAGPDAILILPAAPLRVRSNDTQELGFLADVRRMNVALTRARRKLLVVGDSATLAAHRFYADLFDYIELEGWYRTVWELQ